ncbi:3048_t:CDS:2, partial [Scutellospora calospora]
MAQNSNLTPEDVLKIQITPICNQMNIEEEDIRRISSHILRNLTPSQRDILIDLTNRINSYRIESQRLDDDNLENVIYRGCEFSNLIDLVNSFVAEQSQKIIAINLSKAICFGWMDGI